MTFHANFFGYFSDNLTINSLSPTLSLYPKSTVLSINLAKLTDRKIISPT